MQREQFEVAGFVEQFGRPTVFLRRDFDIAQHAADVNRLAVIAAVIYAEFLHAENFTQSCDVARKILARIA